MKKHKTAATKTNFFQARNFRRSVKRLILQKSLVAKTTEKRRCANYLSRGAKTTQENETCNRPQDKMQNSFRQN